MRTALLLTLIATVGAAGAYADELRLLNGDRITGTVASLDAGTLALTTAYGSLHVPWTEVASLFIDEPILVRNAAGEVARFNGGPLDVALVAGLSRPEPPLTWTGGASAGILATGGNTDVNSLRLDGELVARALPNRYTVTALLNRAKDAGRDTARNWSASGRYDRFLSDRMYVNGSALFTNDDFRELDLRTAFGVALGYEAIDTALATLSAEGGIGWVNEDFATAPDDSYTAVRESAKLDVLVAADRLVLFHQHDAYFGVTGDDNLFFKMRNGVRLGLLAGMVTTAQVDTDYDRSPSPGRKSTDHTFALTLGYRF